MGFTDEWRATSHNFEIILQLTQTFIDEDKPYQTVDKTSVFLINLIILL